MDPATAISMIVTFIKTANELAPTFVQAFNDLKPFAVALYQKLTGQDISAEDLAVLEAQIDALHAELQAPMPPAS